MVAKVLARVPLVRRRKPGVKNLKVKTEWTIQESIFSTVGEGKMGRISPLRSSVNRKKKAIRNKTEDFHLRGRNLEIRFLNILENNQFYHAFITQQCPSWPAGWKQRNERNWKENTFKLTQLPQTTSTSKQTNKRAWTITHFSDASSRQLLFPRIDFLVCIAFHFYVFIPQNTVKPN